MKTREVVEISSSPLQQLILQALEVSPQFVRQDQSGSSRYAFAVACGFSPGSIYRKLTMPVMSDTLERMLAVLNPTITVQGLKYRLFVNNSGEVALSPENEAAKKMQRTFKTRNGAK